MGDFSLVVFLLADLRNMVFATIISKPSYDQYYQGYIYFQFYFKFKFLIIVSVIKRFNNRNINLLIYRESQLWAARNAEGHMLLGVRETATLYINSKIYIFYNFAIIVNKNIKMQKEYQLNGRLFSQILYNFYALKMLELESDNRATTPEPCLVNIITLY